MIPNNRFHDNFTINSLGFSIIEGNFHIYYNSICNNINQINHEIKKNNINDKIFECSEFYFDDEIAKSCEINTWRRNYLISCCFSTTI